MTADGLERVLADVDLSDAPALSEALVELRRKYDDEEARREAVETKTSGLLALDAVLIPLVVDVSQSIRLPLRVLLLALLLGSAGLCIATLRSERYKRPLEQPEHVVAYAQLDRAEFALEFLETYLVSVSHNREINDRRYRRFNWALIVTAVAVVVTGVVSLLPS